MSSDLHFSIILPVCHGGELLRAAMDSIRKLDYPPEQFEVIVKDETNRSAALNAACGEARGKWLAFADDDCVLWPDWLKALRAVTEREPDAGMIGGVDELVTDGSAFDLALDSVLNSFWGTGGLRRGAGVRAGRYYPRLWNMAIARDAIVPMLPRVFDESLDVHEDVELAERIRRAGRRIVFAPDWRVGHRRDTNYGSFVRRNFGMARVAGRTGIHRLPHTVLAACVIGALLFVPGSLFIAPLQPVLMFTAGVYGAVLLFCAVVGFVRARKLKVLAIIPALLVSCHFARGAGYLAGLASRRRAGS
jgi:GT2 family glycosyltransferase